MRVIGDELRSHLRLDATAIVITAVYLLLFVPILPHATSDPQLLNILIDDETPLTMALDGMRAFPYGDPFNFILAAVNGQKLPAYWGNLNYAGVGYYYGGTYFGLAFLIYGPLQALGLPAFPTAPIILRVISAASGLIGLLIAYNFSRYHSGRIAALVVAAFLMTDPYFIYYATIIHPDSTQFGLALLALTICVRHVKFGEVESLTALGLLSGLIQGTKSGGPWLIPIVAMVTTVALWRQRSGLPLFDFFRRLAFRTAWLLVVAFAAYFVSTPYAFLKSDFLVYTRILGSLLGESSMVPTTYADWIAGLWTHFTPMLMLPAIAGTGFLVARAARRDIRGPLFLAVVLGLSQLAWYGAIVKYWVELGYMLCLFAVIALLVGHCTQAIWDWLSRAGAPGRALAVVTSSAAMFLVIGGHWYDAVAVPLTGLLTDANTSVQIGRWAEAGNIPHDARILWDDAA
ncbi:MAG: hypothetical protein JO166_20370, partial [Deltaproteobacteria bacterium]|nr:hypothetical protein [Deltaproteobacteria bacterium]